MNTDIDDQIDKIPMHEMTGAKAAEQINPNSLRARLKRRKIRYFMYRLRTLEEKNHDIMPKNVPEGFVELYESQHGFDGWANFAVTWDISLHDTELVMSRMFSEAEEWERIVMAKFPQIQHDGSIKYPDMAVKKAVDEEAIHQDELREQNKSE